MSDTGATTSDSSESSEHLSSGPADHGSGSHRDELARLADAPRNGLTRELVAFLRANKKWWLTPILLAILLLGILIATGGGPAGPFIYTLF